MPLTRDPRIPQEALGSFGEWGPDSRGPAVSAAAAARRKPRGDAAQYWPVLDFTCSSSSPLTHQDSIYMPSKEEGLNLGGPMGTDLFNLPESGSAKVCQRNTG